MMPPVRTLVKCVLSDAFWSGDQVAGEPQGRAEVACEQMFSFCCCNPLCPDSSLRDFTSWAAQVHSHQSVARCPFQATAPPLLKSTKWTKPLITKSFLSSGALPTTCS